MQDLRGWKKWLLTTCAVVLLALAVLAAPVGVQYFRYLRPDTELPATRLATVRNHPENRSSERFAAQAVGAMRETANDASLPGISAAIFGDDGFFWAGGIGYAHIEERIPVGPESRFRLGSVSKAVTGVLLGRMLDEGTVQLDRPIETYAPGVPGHLGRLTLLQLASHTGGVRHYHWTDFNPYTGNPWSTANGGMAIFADDPLLFPPGTDFRYSTYGYTLLSRVLAAAADTPFSELLQTRVFGPAGMMNSTIETPEPVAEGRVSFFTTGDNRYTTALPQDVSYKWAGGGLLGSAVDLARLGDALLSDELLSAPTRELIWTPVPLADGSANDQNYALGWRRGRLEKGFEPDGTEVLHHGGIQIGGAAFFAVLPELGLSAAALTNTGTADARAAVQDLTLELLRLAAAEADLGDDQNQSAVPKPTSNAE